jgi:radical SAM protein with 4Fe4S-binding SPASM domain
MNFDEFKKFVDNNPFLEDIVLTGGQVTLHPDIVKMWLYLDKKGYRTGGPTNAVNLSKVKKVQQQVLNKLSGRNTHFLGISIDGIGKENDRIRGTKGGFKNAMKLVKWVLEKQKEFPFLQLTISRNITPTNYKTFPEFVDYFVNLGLKPTQITFRPTQSLTRYKLVNTKEIVNQEKTKVEVLKSIKKVTDKYPELNSYYLKYLPTYYKNPKKQVIPCYAGVSVMFIDTFWNVYPCIAMESFPMGNLRETDFKLKSIWRSEKAKDIQIMIKNNKCTNCWVRCYGGYSMLSNTTKLLKLLPEHLNKLLR